MCVQDPQPFWTTPEHRCEVFQKQEELLKGLTSLACNYVASDLDIGRIQEIRTITIGRISGRSLAGKHAASMLRMPFRV